MAIDASAVLDAVRGVIRGELGSVRTVSTTYGEESHEATSDAERWIRGAAEVQADVQVTSGPWHSGAVGPGTASSGLWVLGLVVELSYSLAPYADLTPGTRYAARQSATEDVERLTLALLAADVAGEPERGRVGERDGSGVGATVEAAARRHGARGAAVD